MRVVASRSASTVERDRSCEAIFWGLFGVSAPYECGQECEFTIMSYRLYSVHSENAKDSSHEQTNAELWSRCWCSRSRNVHRWCGGGNRRFPHRAMDFEPAPRPGLYASNFWLFLSDPRVSHVREQSLR